MNLIKNTHIQSVRTLIIGAGLSGLMSGRILHDAGEEILILDKGRGVGGRCATRRIHEHKFDHGAQFYTAKSPTLKLLSESWLTEGLVRKWFSSKRDTCYCATNGMSSIAKSLSMGLPIRTSQKVIEIQRHKDYWLTYIESGEIYRSKQLISTAPYPQTRALLSTSLLDELQQQYPSLTKISYQPCFAVMVLTDASSHIQNPNEIPRDNPYIDWIADNAQKVNESDYSALTIHTTPSFTNEHLETDKEQILALILNSAQQWIKGTIIEAQVHRWLYARPLTFVGSPFVKSASTPRLCLCGDYMQSPATVESAILSGFEAANGILGTLLSAN